jgi:hypothetical protein
MLQTEDRDGTKAEMERIEKERLKQFKDDKEKQEAAEKQPAAGKSKDKP